MNEPMITIRQFQEKWPSRGSITIENFQEFYKDFQHADDDHLRHLRLSADNVLDPEIRSVRIDQLNKIHTIHRRFPEFIEWLTEEIESQSRSYNLPMDYQHHYDLDTFINYIDQFETFEYPYEIRCIRL